VCWTPQFRSDRRCCARLPDSPYLKPGGRIRLEIGALRRAERRFMAGARALGGMRQRPGAAGGCQDRCGQQDSKDSGCHVRDRVRVMEAGRGRLRRRRHADQQRRPGRPVMAGPVPPSGDHAERGRAQPHRDQPDGRSDVPECRQHKAAASEIQGRGRDQRGGDQPPTGQAARSLRRYCERRGTSRHAWARTAAHQHAIASFSCSCWRSACNA
jgi:hypothetical protein